MDAATLQNRIYKGYDKAAQRIGINFTIYRASTAINPLDPANAHGSIMASFNVSWSYERANKYGNAVWQLVADGTLLQPYDYLKSTDQTYFVAGMQLTLPMLAVSCNQTVTIKRQTGPTGVGYQGYSGYDDTTAQTIYQNCPASYLQGTRGTQSDVNLPTDVKMPWFIVLIPYLGNQTIQTGDFLQNSNGINHIISSAELTDLGWRLTIASLGA